MKLVISIDDTDNIESRGTGDVAELLARGITDQGFGECGLVTRHQLLLHPDIPYTSHNSAMCFPAQIEPRLLTSVTAYLSETLKAESAAGSDPGLCILDGERPAGLEAAVAFGLRAKREILTKVEAYRTAQAHGIHLSEHGGTGLGVIGALAGAGLRLTGNDGRFKGRLAIPTGRGIATVALIRAAGIDVVKTLEGELLSDSVEVMVGEWVKPVLLENRAVLLVVPAGAGKQAPWKSPGREFFTRY